MRKAGLRLCAFFILCALLVYLPEIYSAVSPPYHIETQQRILLRISLCAADPLSANAFFRALSSYMKEHPSVHIRVTRTNADQLFSLSDSQCDLLLFPDSILFDHAFFLLPSDDTSPLTYFSPSGCTPLLCGVSRHTRQPDQAFLLAEYLHSSIAAESSALSFID